MQVVSIPSTTSYFNLYLLSGYASTKSLILTNNTSSPVLVLQASVPELERVLAANSVFLFRTTNTGTVTSKFSSKNTWFEGDLSVTT